MTQQSPPPGHPQQPPQWAAPAPPPPAHAAPPKKRRWWPWLLPAAVLLLLFIWILADAAGGDNQPDPATPTSPTETQTWTVKPTPATAGPVTNVAPGKYEVGTSDGQIAPGKYKSNGPDNGPSGICYYARLHEGDGGPDDILSNNATQGPSVFTVKPSDGYVEVAGCTFTKAG